MVAQIRVINGIIEYKILKLRCYYVQYYYGDVVVCCYIQYMPIQIVRWAIGVPMFYHTSHVPALSCSFD